MALCPFLPVSSSLIGVWLLSLHTVFGYFSILLHEAESAHSHHCGISHSVTFHASCIHSAVDMSDGQTLTPSPLIVDRVSDLIVVVVQPPSRVQLFMTPWTAACQASLSLTIS